MDTTGTFEMAIEMAKHSRLRMRSQALHSEQWSEFASKHPSTLKHVALSTGIGQADMKKMDVILSKIPEITFICMDVANGYANILSSAFEMFERSIRSTRSWQVML